MENMEITSGSTIILLNGLPRPWFWYARSLRQGDVLSPLLLLIVMEFLNLMFSKAEEDGLLSAFAARVNG